MKPKSLCQNLYAFIRLRLGEELSDRELARRWKMEWKSFNALKHGRRQIPRIGDLEQLATLLEIDAAFVFEVARGVSAKTVNELLVENDAGKLSRLLMAGVHAVGRQAESLERRYVAILERVSDAVFTMDVQGRLQDVNPRLCTLTGFTDKELLALTLFDLILPAQRPTLVGMAAAVYQRGEVHGATFVVTAKSGAQLVLELGLTRIDGEDGQAIGIQAVAHDVTERKRLEDQLQQQLATLQTTFDAVPVACLLFAKDGTVLLGNRLVEHVTPWSDAEIMGRNSFEVFGNPGPVGCPVARAFQTGKLEQQISQMRNKRGEEVYVHRTAGPVPGADGQVDKVVEILVDVSEQVRRGDPGLTFGWGKQLSPSNLESQFDREHRKFLRVPLEVPVTYRVGAKRALALARNVGRGGICLETPAPVPIGSEISLEWTLPGRRGVVTARGVVIWTQPEGVETSPGVGIEFSDLALPSRKAIARCVVNAARRASRRHSARRRAAD